jgi:hypothetical protein
MHIPADTTPPGKRFCMVQDILSPGLKSDILIENSPPQRVATFRIIAYLPVSKGLKSIVIPFAVGTAYR